VTLGTGRARTGGQILMRSKLLFGGLGAAVAFLLATSPVVAQAAAFITSADIVNNTIKSKDVKDNALKGQDVKDGSLTGVDIANGSVADIDLAAAAKGAKVIRYNLGAHDFTGGGLSRTLPGTWNAATVQGSSWFAMAHGNGGFDYALPGWGASAATAYRVYVDDTGEVFIEAVTGPGEAYDNVSLYRTIATSTASAPTFAGPKHSDK
jgi:hypothetical protein